MSGQLLTQHDARENGLRPLVHGFHGLGTLGKLSAGPANTQRQASNSAVRCLPPASRHFGYDDVPMTRLPHCQHSRASESGCDARSPMSTFSPFFLLRSNASYWTASKNCRFCRGNYFPPTQAPYLGLCHSAIPRRPWLRIPMKDAALAARAYLTGVRGIPSSAMERLKTCPDAQLHPRTMTWPCGLATRITNRGCRRSAATIGPRRDRGERISSGDTCRNAEGENYLPRRSPSVTNTSTESSHSVRHNTPPS